MSNVTPWRWLPSLYFSQGLPYAAVMTLSVVLYKNLGISNTDIALYTSWLYLPWVLKPLWAPWVAGAAGNRAWIVATQSVVAALLAALAFTLPLEAFWQWSLAVFWLMAFASSTHDIAADGFYLQALDARQQSLYVGWRSLFFRAAMLTSQGLLVWIAGHFIATLGDPKRAWMMVFGGLAAWFAVVSLWHAFTLPRVVESRTQGRSVWQSFVETWRSFVAKPGIAWMLAFLLLFRLGEAQALKMLTPFLLDPRDKGGLALTTAQVGVVYGTFGVAALTLGGILGGWAISRFGLKRAMLPMLFAVHVPNLLFVALAIVQPISPTVVGAALVVEQFGYGFGFTAYLMAMVSFARNANDTPLQTTHYSLCTGFMALGMMLPGMWSGWLQTQVGYAQFFVWVCVCCLPSFWAASRLKFSK